MANVTQQKCPTCGAAMRYDPAKARLVCDYCGAETEIPQESAEAPAEEVLQGFDFTALNAQATCPEAEALPIYHCQSCGAEVIAPAEQIALTCPYCASNIVLTDKVSGKLRPDGVIPFRIDAKSLPEAMNRYYRDKILLPKRFFSESTMGRVTGVYVPFWVFSGRISGVLHFIGRRSSTYRQGDYMVTDTNRYRLSRDVELAFEDVPVDASGRIDDKLMDSLEPFDMSEEKTFDMRYLAGFTADRFDLARDDIAPRAEQRMFRTAQSIVTSAAGAGYESVTPAGGSLRTALRARYLLLPVYLFDVAHDGQNYHFAVNGQTGKVVGEIPTDKGVSLRYFLKRALVPLLGAVAAAFGLYMLGR